jgi:hypothetical protein
MPLLLGSSLKPPAPWPASNLTQTQPFTPLLLVQAFLAVTGSTDGPKPVEWDFLPCHDPSLAPTSLSTAALNATAATADSPVAGSARRMLLRSGGKKRRAEVSEEVVFTDWVVPCQEGRLRCPNLYLASQGYQARLADQLSLLRQAAGWFAVCMFRHCDGYGTG